MVGVLDGEKSLVIILFKPLYLPRVLPTLGSLIIPLPLAGAKESSSGGGLLTICPSSAECWGSAGQPWGGRPCSWDRCWREEQPVPLT